jgi:hypothetical protein
MAIGPIAAAINQFPPREGFTQRVCNYSEERMAELLVEGYKPCLNCQPVVFDVGGGQKAILMEIETWAYNLRMQGNTSYEVEKIIEDRVAERVEERLDNLTVWQLIRIKIRKTLTREHTP